MNKPRQIVLGTASLVVVLVILTIVLLSRPDSASPYTGDRETAASAVAAALRHLEDDPTSLVASGANEQVGKLVDEAFPVGTQVMPKATTWAPDGVGGGTMAVTVTLPDKKPITYSAVMVQENGNWKVLATVPVPVTSS